MYDRHLVSRRTCILLKRTSRAPHVSHTRSPCFTNVTCIVAEHPTTKSDIFIKTLNVNTLSFRNANVDNMKVKIFEKGTYPRSSNDFSQADNFWDSHTIRDDDTQKPNTLYLCFRLRGAMFRMSVNISTPEGLLEARKMMGNILNEFVAVY